MVQHFHERRGKEARILNPERHFVMLRTDELKVW
jgi:hypothetical protein